MAKQVEKPSVKTLFIDGRYYRTVLDTTSYTPAELCDPVSLRSVSNMLSARFAQEAEPQDPENNLPQSVTLMFAMIWLIGLERYSFPEGGEFVVSDKEDGPYVFAFGYANQAGSQDDLDGYVDPEYMDMADDYMSLLLSVAPNGMRVLADEHRLVFDSKRAIYELLENMLNDEETFDLNQPEELLSLLPAQMSQADAASYLEEKISAYVLKALDEDKDGLLDFSPFKQYVSMRHYLADAAMSYGSHFFMNLEQIREIMIHEGEKNLPANWYGAKAGFSFGVH